MLLLAGCSPQPAAYVTTEVTAVHVSPGDTTATVSPGAPVQLTYTADADFIDGDTRPLDLVSWTSSNDSVGAIDLYGTFTSVDDHGGTTTITANHLGIEGSSTLTLLYTERVLETDESVADALDAATGTAGTTAFTYPPDGVTVPRNIEGFAFAWPDGNVARLRFQSDITDVSVYVEGTTWVATSSLWESIAAANRKGTVSVTLTTGTWDGSALSDVEVSEPLSVTVNRLDARGSVLYWQTSTTSIMRIPFGSTTASQFYPATADGTCLGCHSIDESTQTMVVTHDGINGVVDLVDVSDPEAPTKIMTTSDSTRLTFKALSPDGQWMVGNSNGTLTLYSMPDATPVRTLDTGGYKVTQPDWSPDGTQLAMVRQTSNVLSDMSFGGGEIVLAPFDGTDLGDATVLVPRGDTNNYYPAFSPDGQWLAYDRSHGDSDADDDSELWLVSLDGAIDLPLDAANGDGTIRNSYPRWAPLPDDDVLWLAWSSKRGYPLADTTQGQIWVSAIDTSLAAQGADPSAPAFWLPGQDTASDNHLPLWWSR